MAKILFIPHIPPPPHIEGSYRNENGDLIPIPKIKAPEITDAIKIKHGGKNERNKDDPEREPA